MRNIRAAGLLAFVETRISGGQKWRAKIDHMILRLLQLILEIIRIIVGRRDAPPDPGPLRGLRRIGSDPMRYEVDFPPFPASAPNVDDIVTLRFTSAYTGPDGPVEDVQDLPAKPTPPTSAQFTVPESTEVTLTLAYVDDDDLSSLNPARQVFTSGDNIPPTDPGDFGAIRKIPDIAPPPPVE